MKNLNQNFVSLDRIERITKLQTEANQLNTTRLDELVNTVNTILTEEGCPTINSNHIKFYPQYIGNTGIGDVIDQELTRIIYNYYYPQATNGEYAHFTDLLALKSILSSKKIRLTSTIKRKDDKEFKLFYEDNNITGFSRIHGDSTYDEKLMKDLFYISLTENKDTNVDIKRGMWKYFGRNGEGVKIVFDINTIHSDFRKVCYSSPNKDILNKLVGALQRDFGKPLVFKSISKIGAFYIHVDFQDEFETRFLIKKYSDDYPFIFSIMNESTVPYIELDFVSDYASIIPIKIQPGLNCDAEKVKQIVNASGLRIEVLSNASSI